MFITVGGALSTVPLRIVMATVILVYHRWRGALTLHRYVPGSAPWHQHELIL